MRLETIGSIDDCSPAQWNAITGTDYPFTRHEFLAALEHSGSVNKESGWEPYHQLIYNDNSLVGVLPLYLKHHSYGEYVFDWSWANAYQRAGWQYYPKLLSAIPFTPATGPRLSCLPGWEDQVYSSLQEHLVNDISANQLSGLHILFPELTAAKNWQERGFLLRLGVQYHWLNQGYTNFEEFIASFSSRKRKNLNKERRRVKEQGVTFRTVDGHKLSESDWDYFYRFYQLTYARYSGHGGYLTRSFFAEVGQALPEHIVMVLAYQHGQPIAAALNYRSPSCLYGRHWGSTSDIDCLHFEACYYQGIDYCIEQRLEKFDPGAQGEHKISRGFTPLPVYSAHWLSQPAAMDAIGQFVDEEASQIREYISQASNALPFKK